MTPDENVAYLEAIIARALIKAAYDAILAGRVTPCP